MRLIMDIFYLSCTIQSLHHILYVLIPILINNYQNLIFE